jgi:hypothetical protein
MPAIQSMNKVPFLLLRHQRETGTTTDEGTDGGTSKYDVQDCGLSGASRVCGARRLFLSIVITRKTHMIIATATQAWLPTISIQAPEAVVGIHDRK